MPFADINESGMARLAASFTSIKIAETKSAMSSVNWLRAWNDYKSLNNPGTVPQQDSFKTSISRIPKPFAKVKGTDKQRLAACFFNIENVKAFLSKVDWDAASTAFQPTGKKISAASFRTSVQRLLDTGSASGGRGAGGTGGGKKRKAVTPAMPGEPASSSPPPAPRKKKSKTARGGADQEARAAPDLSDLSDEDSIAKASTRRGKKAKTIKKEQTDDSAPGLENDDAFDNIFGTNDADAAVANDFDNEASAALPTSPPQDQEAETNGPEDLDSEVDEVYHDAAMF